MRKEINMLDYPCGYKLCTSQDRKVIENPEDSKEIIVYCAGNPCHDEKIVTRWLKKEYKEGKGAPLVKHMRYESMLKKKF